MIKVSSFNIRCYGLGGEYSGRFRDEKRNANIKNFIKTELSDCDVMVFQEIIDVEVFKGLVPRNYKTFTYDHSFKRHQRVVICLKDSFDLSPFSTVEGTTLDERYSRPALYGQVVDKKSNKALLHIIGVHLKSGHLHSETRLKQSTAITKFINSLDQSIPIVLSGDFNSQPKERTGLKQNDVVVLNEVFEDAGLSLIQNSTPTYHTNWEQQVLDHIWVSKKYVESADLWVYDVTSSYHGDLNTYYKEISDHLPIKATFYF